MNSEMAYLLGMVCGNGEISRGNSRTVVAIEIPHKKLRTESCGNVAIYVKASIADIRTVLEPLIGTGLGFTQTKNVTTLSFEKENGDYLMRELLRYVGRASSHENVSLCPEIFSFSRDEKLQFLKGFADVTGYIRRSNYCFKEYMHRVYLEIPRNWELVAQICNLLASVDIPVQNIDWAHPNMRDGNLKKYRAGNTGFWKKEHQIKIWANEFLPVGFAVLHKMEALAALSDELKRGLEESGRTPADVTHRYYWETRKAGKKKPPHPAENDAFLPPGIRGRHYDSWKEIARDLGYPEKR